MRGRGLSALALVGALAAPAHARPPRWQELPPIPAMPAPAASGEVVVGDARIHWASWGPTDGTPADRPASAVVLLHGALGNGDYLALQAAALAPAHRVIAIDARGQGRSTRGTAGLHYHLLAEDVIAVLDALAIPRASVVGWSDGAIVGLDLAMHHGDRVAKVFAFAANTDLGGFKHGGGQTRTMKAYFAQAKADTKRLAPAPAEVDKAIAELERMSATEPRYSAAELGAIRIPVAVVDGDHDEIIQRAHTERIAKRIPGATLIILPDASHFALWQAPAEFNRALLEFLDGHP